VTARQKLEEYQKEFTAAMQIQSDEPFDPYQEESQSSDTTFGSWRRTDDDILDDIQGEWDIYLTTARAEISKDSPFESGG
jgi:hypothetical protein